MTKEEKSRDPVIDLRNLPRFLISLSDQNRVVDELKQHILHRCAYKGNTSLSVLFLAANKTLYSIPDGGTLTLSDWRKVVQEYFNPDNFDTWKSFTDALCGCAYTLKDRDQDNYVRALKTVVMRVCDAWRQTMETCKEEPDAGSPGHPDPKSSEQGGAMKEGHLVVGGNLSGRLIPQGDVMSICSSMLANDVYVLFEPPLLPTAKPLVDALAWAWRYCAEHGGNMPLEAFVSTFKGLAYNVWPHAPVLRAKFAMAVERWCSKRTEVRNRLDRSVLRSEADLYYIAKTILGVWPESWEPGMVGDKQEAPKESLGAPCAAEERPVDKDCFRTLTREADLLGFGPCLQPPVRFKSWAEYPGRELPSESERRTIRQCVLKAMNAWASLSAVEFDESSADQILARLFYDFAYSVLVADDGRPDVARHQLLNAHDMLNHVMTRRIIGGIAKTAELSFDQVYDYLCAFRLRLEWLLDSQEGIGRKGAATAPCTCGHEFETETRGENTTMSIFGNLFNNSLFGKPETNRFKIDYAGRIAVNTSKGYKAYDIGKKRLVNCSSFCTSFGSDMFFVVPTNKPKAGDIILQANGAPLCVIEVTDEGIRALDYENSRIETVVPERHALLGNFCLYGKVVSLASKLFPGGVRGLLGGDDGEVSLKGVMLMNMFKDGSNPFEGGDGMMQLLLFSKLMRGEGDKSFKSILLLKLMEQKGGDASGMLPLLLADECGGSVKNLLLMQAASGGKGGDITQLLLMQSLMKDGDGSLDFGDLFGDDDEEALAEKPGKTTKKKK